MQAQSIFLSGTNGLSALVPNDLSGFAAAFLKRKVAGDETDALVTVTVPLDPRRPGCGRISVEGTPYQKRVGLRGNGQPDLLPINRSNRAEYFPLS